MLDVLVADTDVCYKFYEYLSLSINKFKTKNVTFPVGRTHNEVMQT